MDLRWSRLYGGEKCVIFCSTVYNTIVIRLLASTVQLVRAYKITIVVTARFAGAAIEDVTVLIVFLDVRQISICHLALLATFSLFVYTAVCGVSRIVERFIYGVLDKLFILPQDDRPVENN